MTDHKTTQRRTTAPSTVRLHDLRPRAEDVVEDDRTEFANLSELVREAVRQIVTDYECRDRLTEDGESLDAANLDPVIDRAPDVHPITDGGRDE